MTTSSRLPGNQTEWPASDLNLMRDAVVELQGVANSGLVSGVFNVKDYGAKGDGIVANEGPAIQAALDAAHALPSGGTVYAPPGTYKKTQMLHVWTNVAFVGAGRNATYIQDTADLGVDTYSIYTDEDGASLRYPRVTDMSFVGPGSSIQSLNSSPANMYGIGLQSLGIAERVNCSGYRGGISFTGNHQTVRDCRMFANYDGIYWHGGGTSFGNQHIDKCELVGNNRAAIGVHGDNTIDSSSFVDVHLGFCPYGIYKENNGSYSKDILTNSWCGLWFEALGNGAIFDQGANTQSGGTNGKAVSYCQFWPSSVTWNATYKISATAADWAVICGDFQNCSLAGDSNGFVPGAVGVFACKTSYNNKFGQGDTYLTNMTGGKLLFNDTADVQGTDFTVRQGGRCSVRKVGGATNPALGDLLYLAGAAGQWGVAKDGAGGGGSNLPVGFLQAWGLGATNHWAPVLVQGVGPQQANAASNLGANALMAADTAGTRGNVVAGTVPGTAANPIVGYGQGVSASKAQIFVTIGG